jgi:hypothetical protein
MSGQKQRTLLPSEKLLQVLDDDGGSFLRDRLLPIKIPRGTFRGVVEIFIPPNVWQCLLKHYGGRNAVMDAIRSLIDEAKFNGTKFHLHEHSEVDYRVLKRKSSTGNKPFNFIHVEHFINRNSNEERTEVTIL